MSVFSSKKLTFDWGSTFLICFINIGFLVPKRLIVFFTGDGNVNSKKDAEIRRKELFEIAAPPILKYLAENLTDIIKVGGTRYNNFLISTDSLTI
jgi:hypothetical protein